ncbi:MAG: hypothetical protein ACOC9O_02165, partial [Myxococcota bacterium]
SLGAVCCGLGFVSAPWFACELSALVLATALGERVPRHRGWLAAGAVQTVAVLVLSAAVGAAVTWLDAEMLLGSPRPIAGGNIPLLVLALGGSAVALLYMVPYLYAPVLLIHRGGRLGGAMLESARRVGHGGLLAHLGLSCASHLLQVAPPLLAAALALALADRAAVPVAVATSLPFMALTLPLGQGMIVSAYLERDRGSPSPREAIGRAPVGRTLALGLTIVGLAPAVALVLVAVAVMVRPSHARPGDAPLGELVAGGAIDHSPPASFPIPQSALEVRASTRHVAVVARDGGGAGAVPLPSEATLERVRVVRVRDAYAVEVGSGDRSWVTWVDRAGVRLDDDLSARLADHLPPWGLPWLVMVMAANGLALSHVLARLASSGGGARRRAWFAVGGLLPLVAVALALGFRALLV